MNDGNMQQRGRNPWDNGGDPPSSTSVSNTGATRGYQLSSIHPSLPRALPMNNRTGHSNAMMPPPRPVNNAMMPPPRPVNNAMMPPPRPVNNAMMPYVPMGRTMTTPFHRSSQANRQFQSPNTDVFIRDSSRNYHLAPRRHFANNSNGCGFIGHTTMTDLHVINRKREIMENRSGRFYDAHAKRVKTISAHNEVLEVAKVSAPANQNQLDSEMHVVFAIDFSTSMNTEDVKSRTGKISRWGAVFHCVNSFLDRQLEQQRQQGTGANYQYHKCVVSVLIFNNESKVLMNRLPLDGNGTSVRTALKEAEKNHTPRGGTSFSTGFHEASRLAAGSHDVNTDNVMVVFLSDGRPGDLRPSAPSHATTPMQTTYRYYGREYRAAGWYIEKMRRNHLHFNLQLVCLYSEGKEWMEYLAKRYEGTLHNPDLTLDEDDTVSRTASRQTGAYTTPSLPPDSSTNAEDDDVIEIKVKSSSTIIREKYEHARDAGKIISLTGATSTQSSSIRSTFDSISDSVTAMRTVKRQERAVIVQANSAMISYEATRMVLVKDAKGNTSFTISSGETPNGRRVQISMHPFAQGGLRNVYRMREYSLEKNVVQVGVAKESRHDIKYQERLSFHLETAICQLRAYQYAKSFNRAISRKNENGGALPVIKEIEFLCTLVYRLKAPSHPGGFRYLAVENELSGPYQKWNNNAGFVNQSDCIECKVAQAFSHFSFERSTQQEMVVDIQGSGSIYTDPQLHSVGKLYGRADQGTSGFDKFFKTHKCNFLCKLLDLPDRSEE